MYALIGHKMGRDEKKVLGGAFNLLSKLQFDQPEDVLLITAILLREASRASGVSVSELMTYAANFTSEHSHHSSLKAIHSTLTKEIFK